jgi:hypothetical protein
MQFPDGALSERIAGWHNGLLKVESEPKFLKV